MPDDDDAGWLAPPPPIAVLTAMNVVMKPLLATPLGRPISGVMLLEFRGRRTGRTIKVAASYHDVDGVPMAFTDRPWRFNFEGGAPVTVTRRGRAHETRGTWAPMAPDEMAVAVRKSPDAGGSTQRRGVTTKVKGNEPSVEELAKIGPALGTSVIRFEFTP